MSSPSGQADDMTTTSATPLDAPLPAVTPALMRQAMGSFASGVTVVTGVHEGQPLGFACQSFSSVSLDPPLILVCADHRGRAWPRLRAAGRFSVNVLGEHQLDLCQRFGSRDGAKYDGLEYTVSRWGTPALSGVLMRVHCDVEDVCTAGDHDIVIGRVLELETLSPRRPMLFFQGAFGITAPPVMRAPELWGWGEHWDDEDMRLR